MYMARGDKNEVMAVINGIKLNGEPMVVGRKYPLINGNVYSGFVNFDEDIRVFEDGEEI